MTAQAPSSALGSLLIEVSALANRMKSAPSTPSEYHRLAVGARAIARLLLDEGPQTVPRIARARRTSRQNIQTAVNRLKDVGCVELVVNPAHKRSVLISLTEQGRRLLADAEADVVRFAGALSGQISEDELASAAALLRQLRMRLFETAQEPSDASAGQEQESTSAKSSKGKSPRMSRETRHKRRSAQPSPVVPREAAEEESELPVSLL